MNSKILSTLQYLLDEGFITLGYKDGEPTVFLTTSLEEVHNAISHRAKDNADWWKK